MGFFFCKEALKNGLVKNLQTFNSLLWDFSFARKAMNKPFWVSETVFQFPLMGFFFCKVKRKYAKKCRKLNFQFPLMGFFFCKFFFTYVTYSIHILSIPSYGIFLLQVPLFYRERADWMYIFQFPLMGFFFCKWFEG